MSDSEEGAYRSKLWYCNKLALNVSSTTDWITLEQGVEEEGMDQLQVLTLPQQAHHAMEKMEEFVFKVWEGRWRVIPDNDFLLHGHRPPMPSFRACFYSIFRLHTETGNIWTHLLDKYRWPRTKLDYSGIALLIMGSFVPWLYYSFYCSPQPRLIYLIIVCVLGITAIVVSQWDRFATPQYRAVRAGVFLGLGLSGLVPTLHFMFVEGVIKAATVGQLGWLFLMAFLYIVGVAVYAARVPERLFPGKCDIWFHSHQIFHVLVVAAALVHLHGISQLQEFRSSLGAGCSSNTVL
ncbi:adiponectin receptor protein 1-like [Hemitrygon akajei]|uniref:adiponectin receptor protein 1-like n=1 Tax=Hemitrygon akajei TaxID=2704970 RepID=UPI003BF9E7C4